MQIELKTEEEYHEDFLYSLWREGEINIFELEAERQMHGLSTVHIRRNEYISEEQKKQQLAGELMNRENYIKRKGKIEIYVDGNSAKCQLPIIKPIGARKEVRGGVRGKVTGFSRQSRLRMMRTVSKLKNAKRPLFITMTYPDEFQGQVDGNEIKEKHLKNFWKRMDYTWPKLSCIWKLEYEERKSGKNVGELFPHLHMLVWGLYEVDIEKVREFVKSAWWEVCGELSGDHLKAGTRVERLRNHRGTMAYLAKYMSKGADKELKVGRWWGVKGRSNLPNARKVVIDFLNKDKYKDVIDFMAMYAGLPEGDWTSLEIFVDGRKMLQQLEKIVYGSKGVECEGTGW